MNIILVSGRLPTAKTIILGRSHILGGCFVLMLALVVLAALMNCATLRYIADPRDPHRFSFASGAVREDSVSRQPYFMAAPDTTIVAAAAGVVVASEHHPQYGNMIEIDHGNGLIARYAHCSRLLAKVGDVVIEGAAIGEVGSSGRATGPHLHFEVKLHGVAQNPARFLRITG